MSETDTRRLGHEPEQLAVTVELPAVLPFRDGEPVFIGPIDQPMPNAAIGIGVGERDARSPMPLDSHNRHGLPRQKTVYEEARSEILKTGSHSK